MSSSAELVTTAQHTDSAFGPAGTAFSTDVAERVSIQNSQKFWNKTFLAPV